MHTRCQENLKKNRNMATTLTKDQLTHTLTSNYYVTLGLPLPPFPSVIPPSLPPGPAPWPSFPPSSVSKAYKKLALKHHPDKQGGKSEGEKTRASKEFERVKEAYEFVFVAATGGTVTGGTATGGGGVEAGRRRSELCLCMITTCCCLVGGLEGGRRGGGGRIWRVVEGSCEASSRGGRRRQ